MRFPQWSGFERLPAGRLLEQLVDFQGALGVAYERAIGFDKGTHRHDRHMLVCTRGASVMNIVSAERRYRADGSHLVWVPRHVEHADESATALYDTLALYPTAALLHSAATSAGLDMATVEPAQRAITVVRRSPFLDELIERYLYARVVRRSTVDPYQERQLVGEALRRLCRAHPSATPPPDATSVATRAARHIESNLFLALTLDEIARASRVSVSSLLRHFRRAFAQTPYRYIQRRRLDEARHLIEQGGHAVGEVALLVGYTDQGAFSKAFRRQFGRPPTSFLPPR